MGRCADRREYSYDEGWRPPAESSAPAADGGGYSPDWRRHHRNGPVSEDGLDAWLEEAQLGSGLQTVHRSYGLLRAGEVRSGATALPAGTYVLALACRSQQPVTRSALKTRRW